jgi:hypothetical protein
MLLLVGTTDALEVVTDAAVTVDVHCSFVDCTKTTGAVIDTNKQATAITTATTTTVVSAAAASTTTRNIKSIHIRNKHATLAVGVTVQIDISAANFELHKVTLLAGQALEYIEGVGFFTLITSRTDRWLRVTAAVTNATTSFADVTGLTCSVDNGKSYNFETHLIHAENATTTGPRFGINGPTLSAIQVSIIDVVTIGVDTTTSRSGTATAVDTSAAGASLTGKTANALAIMSGQFTTGAAGTFAVRFQSEVAVASAVIVAAGSWCHLWEATG